MRNFIRSFFSVLAKNDNVWFFLKPFVSSGILLFHYRYSKTKKTIDKGLEAKLFHHLKVQNGPFRGMNYPAIQSVGSSIYPKLLGCYEKELWETVAYLKNKDYSEIIDIGCAEGYYAVGFGIGIPNAKVYAYDTSENARTLCEKMAKLNSIGNQVTIKSECTPEELQSFPFTDRGLVICDCEGCEKGLFNQRNVQNLVNCDLLIETHDFIDESISEYLKGLFGKTHYTYLVPSINDIEKALTYDLPGLEKVDFSDKLPLFAEHRRGTMEWLICVSKNLERADPIHLENPRT